MKKILQKKIKNRFVSVAKKSSVRNNKYANAILRDVRDGLSNNCDIHFPKGTKIHIKVVTKKELDSKRRQWLYFATSLDHKTEDSSLALTLFSWYFSWPSWFHFEKVYNGEIFVLRGLERSQFEALVAHELGHLYLKRYPLLSRDLEEGLCELFALLYLKNNLGVEKPPGFWNSLKWRKKVRGRGLQVKLIEREFNSNGSFQNILTLNHDLNLPLPQFVEYCTSKKRNN